MSNIPTPQKFPLSAAQVNTTIDSILSATQSLLSTDPSSYANLWATFIKFYSHPTFQLLLGTPPQAPSNTAPLPDNQRKAELMEIKSTINALSKAVSGLQPKAKGVQALAAQTPTPKGNPSTQGKGPLHAPPLTYASLATSPTRASLVLDMGAPPSDKQIIHNLTKYINSRLHNAGLVSIQFSAARYMKQGNLILMAHHATPQSQLNAGTHIIKSLVKQFYAQAGIQTDKDIQIRPNIKWSKLLINSVPVGISNSRGPWTPEECHCALIAHNPSYATLKVTQKPSWVHPLSTLKKGSQSSLVVAFEDPNGSARSSLLSSHQLFLLSTRAKITHWKEKPQPKTNTTHAEQSPVTEAHASPPEELTASQPEEPSTPTPPATRATHSRSKHVQQQ